MPIMILEALRRQLLLRRSENRLAEALDAQLAHERQARGPEERLLPHGRGIGDVRDGDEGRRVAGGVPPEDYVEGGGGLEVWC